MSQQSKASSSEDIIIFLQRRKEIVDTGNKTMQKATLGMKAINSEVTKTEKASGRKFWSKPPNIHKSFFKNYFYSTSLQEPSYRRY